MADKGLRSWQPCPPRSAGGPSWRRLRPWAGGPGPWCRVPRRSASSAFGHFCDLIPMIGGIAPIEILPWWHRRSTFRALLEHLGCRYDAALLLRSTLRRCRARCCARPHDLEPLQVGGPRAGMRMQTIQLVVSAGGRRNGDRHACTSRTIRIKLTRLSSSRSRTPLRLAELKADITGPNVKTRPTPLDHQSPTL